MYAIGHVRFNWHFLGGDTELCKQIYQIAEYCRMAFKRPIARYGKTSDQPNVFKHLRFIWIFQALLSFLIVKYMYASSLENIFPNRGQIFGGL